MQKRRDNRGVMQMDWSGQGWLGVAGGAGEGVPAVQHSLNYSSASEWGASDRERKRWRDGRRETQKREVG